MVNRSLVLRSTATLHAPKAFLKMEDENQMRQTMQDMQQELAQLRAHLQQQAMAPPPMAPPGWGALEEDEEEPPVNQETGRCLL